MPFKDEDGRNMGAAASGGANGARGSSTDADLAQPKSMRPSTARRRPPKVKENASAVTIQETVTHNKAQKKAVIMKEGEGDDDDFFKDDDEDEKVDESDAKVGTNNKSHVELAVDDWFSCKFLTQQRLPSSVLIPLPS